MKEAVRRGRHLEIRNSFSSLDDTLSMSMPQLKERLLLAADPRPLGFWRTMHEEEISRRDFNGGALLHIMECNILQQLEEVLSFSQEQIEDGGHLWMDNISHDHVGHSLSHSHHNWRFFPTTYLDPHRVKLILGKIAFQGPMRCRNMIWDDGSPHGRSTNMKGGRRHPQLVEWMWMVSKEQVSYLQIYDTGQQEAWLRWLFLKEFGHHLAYIISKGMMMEKMWKDVGIMEQQRVWMHSDDATFISFTMSSSHVLYDESIRKQQEPLFLGLFFGEKEQI